MRSSKTWIAVAAVLVSGAAQAQVRFPRERSTRPDQPPPAQPAPPQTQPAPGTQPAPHGQPADPTGGLSPEQQMALGTLYDHNGFGAQAGKMAAQRGASDAVKRMGQQLERDHERIQRELVQLTAERQIDPKKLPRSPQAAQSFAHHLQRWQSLSGPEFDRAFVAEMKDMKIAWEQELKDLRDRTPGKDARLKKWVDDVENVAEDHKTLARQTEKAIGGKSGQVQGRTPPNR